MTSRFAPAAVLCLPLLAATIAFAADDSAYVSAGLNDTVHLGFGHDINDRSAWRVELGHAKVHAYDHQVDDLAYRVKPDADTSLSLLGDWFPVADSGFRLTAGLRYTSASSSTWTAAPGSDGSYHLNGHSYGAAEVGALSGRTTYDKLQPYLGIGWDSGRADRAGWHLIGDVGVDLQHGAHTRLDSTGGQNNTALQQDVAVARQQLSKDAGGTKFRLGATIGLAYSF